MKEFLTPEGAKEVKQKLEEMKMQCPGIIKEIRDAQEKGDLAENSELTAAKDRQAQVLGEIQRLEGILKEAEVVTERPKDGSIGIGSKVTISSEEKSYIYSMVGSIEADPFLNKLSPESPLGKALFGRKANEVVEVKTPKGMVKYKIIKIE